nr:uncharacterized protein LOC109183739 isoform X5 [Ipomoea trifida]GLL21324.1 uncharacterized protein LOC109183739 isoform X5 [Ipomoea trifida]
MPLILPITDDTGNRESRPCQLLLSDTHLGDSPRLLYIYKRWVSSIYAIRGDGFGFSKKKIKTHRQQAPAPAMAATTAFPTTFLLLRRWKQRQQAPTHFPATYGAFRRFLLGRRCMSEERQRSESG